jgi:uncharacterized protein YlxW (UPF0749 family)
MAARRPPSWRLLVPVTCVLAGVLFVTSAISSGGTDLRAGRFSDLASLVNQQSQQVQALRARARILNEHVNALSGRVGAQHVSKARQEALALRGPVGLDPVTGPGLTVTLDDAPSGVISSADTNPNNLVVHQQDIQAVANALWAGGAEAMTIQGQRVIATTGIKCVGNTVVLHDVPYSPPYVISAIGDPESMLTSLNNNPYLIIYRQYVVRWQLGYSVAPREQLRLPGFSGSVELSYARPAGSTGTTVGGNGQNPT